MNHSSSSFDEAVQTVPQELYIISIISGHVSPNRLNHGTSNYAERFSTGSESTHPAPGGKSRHPAPEPLTTLGEIRTDLSYKNLNKKGY